VLRSYPAGLPMSKEDALAGDRTATPFAFIIDDEEGICRFIAIALAKLGVESATFHAAKPAISALDERQPAIIFLDVALANSDAVDVVKGLSGKRYAGAVQLMSGGNPLLIDTVQRIGARHGLILNAPLQKPFRIDEIREIVANLELGRTKGGR
jgi:DNA-binding NtrC family response regulator